MGAGLDVLERPRVLDVVDRDACLELDGLVHVGEREPVEAEMIRSCLVDELPAGPGLDSDG